MSIVETVVQDLGAYWGDLTQIVEADAKTAWNSVTTIFKSFAEDEMAILAGAADKAIGDLEANPLEVLTPEAEMTVLLNYLGGQEVVEISKVTKEVSAVLIANARLAAVPQTAAPAAQAQAA